MITIEKTYEDIYSKIAFNWAPVLYQHVNLKNPLRDMLCAINYDQDWDTSNNRQNLYVNKNDLIPVVYYSVSETTSHYYILYCFYHADDLTHENDLEGCLVIVEKENSELLGIITIAHFDFYSYVYKDRLEAGIKSIAGKLFTERLSDGYEHPMVTQEVNKHGCYAWKGVPFWMRLLPWWWSFWTNCNSYRRRNRPWWKFLKSGRRDSAKHCIGIKYYPSNKAVMPNVRKIKSFNKTQYGYILTDIFSLDGFWDKRYDLKTFKSWGIFNSITRGSASAPWVWDDFDVELDTGTIFSDPARIASKYFNKKFNSEYIKFMNRNKK